MKHSFAKAMRILVSIAVLYYIVHRLDFVILFGKVISAKYILLVSALFFRLFINPFISVNRWKLFLKNIGIEESFFYLLKVIFISSFMGILLPSSQGPDAVRMFIIERKHRGFSNEKTASSSVLIERMIGFAVLAAIGLLSSMLVPAYPEKHRVIGLITLINIILYITIFILTNQKAYISISGLLSRAKRLKKVMGFVDRTHFSLVSFPYRNVIVASTLLICLLQLSAIFILWLVFMAFGVSLPFYNHLSFYPIIAILSMMPITISGFGIREGFFVYFYGMLGVAPEVAVIVSLMNYTIEVMIPALFGGVLYMLKSIGVIKL